MLRVRLLCLKLANFELELRECASCATFVYLKLRAMYSANSSLLSCEFRAGAAGAHFAHHFCAYKFGTAQSELRESSLCRLLWRALRASFVRNVAIAQAELPESASHIARRRSESASTHAISADGSPSSRRIRAAPQQGLRHARSPQRVRRAADTFRRRHIMSRPQRPDPPSNLLFNCVIRIWLFSLTPVSLSLRRNVPILTLGNMLSDFAQGKRTGYARGCCSHHTYHPQRARRAQDTFAPRDSESALTHAISAAGLPSSGHIRAAPQSGRFDTHNLRRVFAEVNKSSQGATARALRHARS